MLFKINFIFIYCLIDLTLKIIKLILSILIINNKSRFRWKFSMKGGIQMPMQLMEVAQEGASAIDFSGFITALTSSITVTQVLTVLGSVVGVGMTFFLMWLGVRKAVKSFTSAVSSGRIRI